MTYSPSEVCEIFSIAKSTLYRWEQDRKISPVSKKLNGEREYSHAHIKEIAEIKCEMLTRELQRAMRIDDPEKITQINKEISQLKALDLDNLLITSHQSEIVIRNLLIQASQIDLSSDSRANDI